MHILRGLITALVGASLLIMGASIFDSSYDVVESVMGDKQDIVKGKILSQEQSVNSTITWNQLAAHSVLIVNSSPSSAQIQLQVTEPTGGAFEKESKNGFIYHIIGKSTQNQGNYSFRVLNLGGEPASINVVLGEDPYLSGKCNSDNQIMCYAIPASIGIVIAGMLALIIGSLVAINDLRKKKKHLT
ncbi:MAG: hypothetical protein KGH88_04835 [Thaumarchaeota archaeon]|nr:hypothetical protein [Nitrososphaerota archaeon]